MIEVRVETDVNPWVRDHARAILERSVDASLRDDRFSDSWVEEANRSDQQFVAAIGMNGTTAVAYVGGHLHRGRLWLEALVDADCEQPDAVFDELLQSALSVAADRSGPQINGAPRSAGADAAGPVPGLTVEVWGRPAMEWHDVVARRHGLVPHRELQQMRCGLPVDAPVVHTRSFVPGQDDEALLRVNNRAFASHPDQGGWDQATLDAEMNEPWFDPDGLRLYEVDGALAGFCWTKIHATPSLGEIYAIGVDPEFHGQGLGVPMTNAGLHWLSEQGLQVGMLYVESNNTAAVRTYERLGFATVRTDRSWASPA